MFLLVKRAFNHQDEKRMASATHFTVRHISTGMYTLYYEERDDMLVAQAAGKIHLVMEGSTFNANTTEELDGLFLKLWVSARGEEVSFSTDVINSFPVFYLKDLTEFSSHALLLNYQGLNEGLLNYYLLLSYNPFFQQTLFNNVCQSLPGATHKLSQGSLAISFHQASLRHYLPSREHFDESAALEELQGIYQRSVKRCRENLRAIHTQLSGGVDTRGLLCELRRQVSGEIHTHGYGPQYFEDNILAHQVVARLPEVYHHGYTFNKGDDFLNSVDEIIFHSSLSTRFDDVGRNFIMSKNMGNGQTPIFSALIVDSMLGDETTAQMSGQRSLTEALGDFNFQFLSYFNFHLAKSLLGEPEVHELKLRLLNHYRAILPEGISEIDAYDALNLLVRHGRGTMGMNWGGRAFRKVINPFITNEFVRFSFCLPKKFKYEARGYLRFLAERAYLPEVAQLPTTRGLVPLSEYLQAPSKNAEALPPLLSLITRDYHQDFYEHNPAFKQFIVEGVQDFDRKQLVPQCYASQLQNTPAVNLLWNVAILNQALNKYF